MVALGRFRLSDWPIGGASSVRFVPLALAASDAALLPESCADILLAFPNRGGSRMVWAFRLHGAQVFIRR